MNTVLSSISGANMQSAAPQQLKMQAKGVDVFYGSKQAINDVSIDIGQENVTAFIGPSGCGKSTFLRCLNRMNDTVDSARVTGDITLDGEDIYAPDMDVAVNGVKWEYRDLTDPLADADLCHAAMFAVWGRVSAGYDSQMD